MKTLATILFGCSVAISTIAQDIRVTFTATGAATTIDSVKATNLRTDQSVTFPGNASLVLTINTGIPTVNDWTNAAMVYPNPFSGSTTLTATLQKPETIHLSVQNLLGRVIAQIQMEVQAGHHRFDLAFNKSGIYAVSFSTDKETDSFIVVCEDGTNSENRIQYYGMVSDSAWKQSDTGLKNSLTSYSLVYTIGDVIHYKCKSGKYTTIFTDIPSTSENYTVEFVECADPDGKNYSVVKIGDQTWMAENLAYLPSVSPSILGSDLAVFYYVYGYEGDSVNEAKTVPNWTIYGTLYNWEAAKTVCPTGWHLPSDTEWNTLAFYLDPAIAGCKMKESGISHWATPNECAANSTGFTALPGGFRYYWDGPFFNLGEYTYFWSSTSHYSDNTRAWAMSLYNREEGIDRINQRKGNGFSIRCMKD